MLPVMAVMDGAGWWMRGWWVMNGGGDGDGGWLGSGEGGGSGAVCCAPVGQFTSGTKDCNLEN